MAFSRLSWQSMKGAVFSRQQFKFCLTHSCNEECMNRSMNISTFCVKRWCGGGEVNKVRLAADELTSQPSQRPDQAPQRRDVPRQRSQSDDQQPSLRHNNHNPCAHNPILINATSLNIRPILEIILHTLHDGPRAALRSPVQPRSRCRPGRRLAHR